MFHGILHFTAPLDSPTNFTKHDTVIFLALFSSLQNVHFLFAWIQTLSLSIYSVSAHFDLLSLFSFCMICIQAPLLGLVSLETFTSIFYFTLSAPTFTFFCVFIQINSVLRIWIPAPLSGDRLSGLCATFCSSGLLNVIIKIFVNRSNDNHD